jgi:CheY-like chemotaxis protein
MKHKLNSIMLIDDDELTNFINRIVLQKSGLTEHIQISEGGREALDYLLKSEEANNDELIPSPDLIFLDINMPAMNGWEFLEEYKKLHLKSRTVVVMLSTSLFPEDKLKAVAIPEISGFMSKPITAEKVEEAIEKYCLKVAEV